MYKLIRDGKIVARKMGTRTFIDVESADRYFESLPRLRSEGEGAK